MTQRWPILVATGFFLSSAFAETHKDFVKNPPQDLRRACNQLVSSDLCKAAAAANEWRQGKVPGREIAASAGAQMIQLQGQNLVFDPAQTVPSLPVKVQPVQPEISQKSVILRSETEYQASQYLVPSILDERHNFQPEE